jgi:adenylate kinase
LSTSLLPLCAAGDFASQLGQQAGRKAEEAILADIRRWFWTRKPDAGFLLEGFPATLLQALVFDEWLETRCEALDAMLIAPDAPETVVDHYRTLGLPVLGGQS